MSAAIGSELHHFLNCLWYGVVLFAVYDSLRIFREMFRHVCWLIGLEDILFWIWAAFYLFSHFFMDTYGAVRGYQLLGVGVGGGIWEYGCGRFLTKKTIFFIRWLKFRIRRCKILLGMRSWMLQKKKARLERNHAKEDAKKRTKEKMILNQNSESVTMGKTTGEKNAEKKSSKKSERKSKQKPFQKPSKQRKGPNKKPFQSRKKLY